VLQEFDLAADAKKLLKSHIEKMHLERARNSVEEEELKKHSDLSSGDSQMKRCGEVVGGGGGGVKRERERQRIRPDQEGHVTHSHTHTHGKGSGKGGGCTPDAYADKGDDEMDENEDGCDDEQFDQDRDGDEDEDKGEDEEEDEKEEEEVHDAEDGAEGEGDAGEDDVMIAQKLVVRAESFVAQGNCILPTLILFSEPCHSQPTFLPYNHFSLSVLISFFSNPPPSPAPSCCIGGALSASLALFVSLSRFIPFFFAHVPSLSLLF